MYIKTFLNYMNKIGKTKKVAFIKSNILYYLCDFVKLKNSKIVCKVL